MASLYVLPHWKKDLLFNLYSIDNLSGNPQNPSGAPQTPSGAPQIRVWPLEPRVETLGPQTELLEPRAEPLEPQAELLKSKAELVAPWVEPLKPRVKPLKPKAELSNPKRSPLNPSRALPSPFISSKKWNQIFSDSWRIFNTQETLENHNALIEIFCHSLCGLDIKASSARNIRWPQNVATYIFQYYLRVSNNMHISYPSTPSPILSSVLLVHTIRVVPILQFLESFLYFMYAEFWGLFFAIRFLDFMTFWDFRLSTFQFCQIFQFCPIFNFVQFVN